MQAHAPPSSSTRRPSFGQRVGAALRIRPTFRHYRAGAIEGIAEDGDEEEEESQEEAEEQEQLQSGCPGANGVPSNSFAGRRRWDPPGLTGSPPRGPAARALILQSSPTGSPPTVPTRADMVAALEKSRVKALSRLPSGEFRGESFDCALCLEGVHPGSHVRSLACGHAYHIQCIDKWLCQEQCLQRRRCPVCNADPITGAAPTDSTSELDGPQSGILFGGVPIEQLLPQWARDPTARNTYAERQRLPVRPAQSHHPHAQGLSALYSA